VEAVGALAAEAVTAASTVAVHTCHP